MGVRGINLSDGDEVVGMQIDTQGDSLLIASEKGMGKRTYLEEFKKQYRGGRGIKCYKIMEKTGQVVGVKAVCDDDELMIITSEGLIIRMSVSGISTLGRITSGVKLVNMGDDGKVVSLAKVRDKHEESEEEQ